LWIAAAALAAAVACAVNPVTGEREFMLISESREIEMGREYDQQIVAQMGLYPDSALQRHVHRLGTRLAANSERPELPWTFRVIDDPIVNAFALPGGFIYITRGILAHMNSEAELAAVLGHEIGHVTARHSASQMSQAMLAQVGLAATVAFVPGAEDFAGVANVGLGLLMMKYGRDDERQSDALGLRYMHAAGYDAREMPAVFEMLGRVTEAAGGSGVPSWLSTHPAPEDRRERIAAQLEQLPPSTTGGEPIVDREGYLRRLDTITFGPDPRQGFFRDATFLHPDMRFRLVFPEEWATQNTAAAVMAGSPQEDAVFQLTLAESKDARTAARTFVEESGVSASMPVERGINGLRALTFGFVAEQDDDSSLEGAAAFIEHDGRVFRLLGYSPRARWPDYNPAFERTMGSFDVLDDPEVLNVQPWRVDILELDRATTLAQLASDPDVPVDADVLALINGVEPTAQVPAGRLVKRVVGEPRS
ncbi:MAG: M48 family metalloprotease, partial [Gemmatimonadota bacterium]